MPKFQTARGTKDLLPDEASAFQHLEAQAREVLARFGYHEIRTPTFEALELFQRSLGETTDVVQKEMYVFEDRGGRKLALRPEGTAGVARAYVEHHIYQTHQFCKLFYIGPMFRAERPQAGRYREFWQIGAEYFGNAGPAADAEVLMLVQTLFRQIGVEDARLLVNSLGDAQCRPKYLEALARHLEGSLKAFCEDCQRRAQKNPLRVLDCKVDKPKVTGVPSIDTYWCAECRSHFQQVQAFLSASGVVFEVSLPLVRGLDYYTRTVFEVTSRSMGAQDALAAGGRYDKLVRDLGGPDRAALGFAMGMERAIEAIRSAKKDVVKSAKTSYIFVAALGEPAGVKAFKLLQDLREDPDLAKAGFVMEGGFFEKKIGVQLGLADRLGASYCVILGEDEIRKGNVTLRVMQTGSQETLPSQDLAKRLLHLART